MYMSRATFMTFFGSRRHDGHPHDPPSRMRMSLILLAAGAVAGGLLGLSATTGVIPTFLTPVVGKPHEAVTGPSEIVLSIISVLVALAGIGLAFFVYLSGRIDWVALRTRLAGPKRALQHGLYVDDFYGSAVVGPAKLGAAFTAFVLDKRVVDGAVNGVGALVSVAARAGRKVQTGLVRSYALALLLGAVGILLFVAVRS
jgi:NADH-quinone oxidoreductase subunit L